MTKNCGHVQGNDQRLLAQHSGVIWRLADQNRDDHRLQDTVQGMTRDC
ncbi:unnamed protein product, partial [Staurois parvus]